MLVIQCKRDEQVRITLPDGREVVVTLGSHRHLTFDAPDDVKIRRSRFNGQAGIVRVADRGRSGR